jgi:Protein of unknown function (DUF1490)
VASVWAGLVVSYTVPALPPSFAILFAVATGGYALALLSTRRQQSVTPSGWHPGYRRRSTINGHGEVGMGLGGIAVKAAGVVASGIAGAVVVDGAKRLVPARGVHDAAVWMVAWGLRGVRAAETGTEKVRLTTADIVSEARERIGEQSLPPGSAAEHNH